MFRSSDDYDDGFDAGLALGLDRGAAVAFGLIGMATAINEREDTKRRQSDYEDRVLEADMG